MHAIGVKLGIGAVMALLCLRCVAAGNDLCGVVVL